MKARRSPVAVRRLELEFKLNLPRLVEGMEERVMEQGEASVWSCADLS